MHRAAFLFLLALSCTSETGSTADAGPAPDARAGIDAPSAGAGTVTWLHDGSSHRAAIALGQRKKDASMDFLAIIASNDASEGVGLVVNDTTPNKPGALSGPYNCPGGTNLQILFTYSTTQIASPMSCTITITSAGVVGGAHATGSFEAVLSDGTLITNGVFDVPVMTPAAKNP